MHLYVDDSLAAGRADTTMESGLRTAIEGILDAERTRIEDLARSARSDRIELLEQKIHRLARSLEDTQQERDRARQRAHALETTAAKSPIVGVAAEPLDREDPQQGRKLALLADLVRENHELRRRMEEQGRGIPRVPASPTPPAPATPRSP
jgi:chromosome segregation ATPase